MAVVCLVLTMSRCRGVYVLVHSPVHGVLDPPKDFKERNKCFCHASGSKFLTVCKLALLTERWALCCECHVDNMLDMRRACPLVSGPQRSCLRIPGGSFGSFMIPWAVCHAFSLEDDHHSTSIVLLAWGAMKNHMAHTCLHRLLNPILYSSTLQFSQRS